MTRGQEVGNRIIREEFRANPDFFASQVLGFVESKGRISERELILDLPMDPIHIQMSLSLLSEQGKIEKDETADRSNRVTGSIWQIKNTRK